jgi:hypothetical protein
MADLDQLRSIDNLQRAWRWVRSNSDASYKSYFRHLYGNFAVADNALLKDLSARLKRNVYQPSKACKLFFPKASGILRPYSLLTVEDQIVYQAAINLIAEKIFPKVKHHYNIQVFGHLYAGKSSTWFYRKWSDGYKAFNDGAREAFSDGFQYTASFDLTACYDSLDHHVLKHFLKKFGLDQKFCEQLSSWLEVWTATEKGIFHRHGIPQGPLSSGLLAEVVLSHFDSLKQKNVDFRYFRYVDDIRLFAKNEKDLRRLLVSLDLLSKDIGLFPQSSKISIKKISDIEKELKSVSNPPEPAIKKKVVDQNKLFHRIVALTPRYTITDITRFKYLLAHAEPSAALTKRLWRIFGKHPEIYKTACNYLRRYPKLPRVPAEEIIGIIKANTLYHSVQAEFISVADDRLPAKQDGILAAYLRKQWSPGTVHPDLLARAGTYLMRTGHLTRNQVIYVCKSARSWWTRATLVNNLKSNKIGAATHDRIVQQGIMDDSHDVALAAGWKTFVDDVSVPSQKRQFNPSGAILLKELGVIKRRTAGYCGIDHALKKLDPKISKVKWKKLMGKKYPQAEKQAIEVAALSGTNITAFVNALDVFNDLLLDALFNVDTTIGKYTLGKIGSSLATSSRFAIKYPAIFALANEVHETRYQSMYSHPRVGITSKPTKKINYRFLGKAKGLLKTAVNQLNAAGY